MFGSSTKLAVPSYPTCINSNYHMVLVYFIKLIHCISLGVIVFVPVCYC